MNPTHVHLLITHLPIYGTLMGIIVLAFAILKKSAVTRSAAYIVFIVAALGGSIAFVTGEEAEEKVEDIQGVSHDDIEEHEEAANYALYTTIALGVLSLAGLVIDNKRPAMAPRFAIVVLLIGLFSFVVTARTGYLGGQIRHTEIKE